jgi:prepilin-type N-terminal cleavage/methylation domain-containing protein
MKDKVQELKGRKGEAGFTLVELLIVLAILAILVAVVLPNFTGLIGKGQDTAAKAELNIVQTAVDAKMAADETATYAPVVADKCAVADMGLSDYMRSTSTTYAYSITADGTVTQGAKCGGGG